MHQGVEFLFPRPQDLETSRQVIWDVKVERAGIRRRSVGGDASRVLIMEFITT